jgi:ketosteroid isomerase-like protein
MCSRFEICRCVAGALAREKPVAAGPLPVTRKRLMSPEQKLVTELYAAFNARDIDRCLAGMKPDVTWANGMEGGFVHGHEAVREYWTRQWKQINPRVEPRSFENDGGKVNVDVHQVVKTLDGTVIFDQMVKHVFTFEDGLVESFEIG